MAVLAGETVAKWWHGMTAAVGGAVGGTADGIKNWLFDTGSTPHFDISSHIPGVDQAAAGVKQSFDQAGAVFSGAGQQLNKDWSGFKHGMEQSWEQGFKPLVLKIQRGPKIPAYKLTW